MSDDIKELVNGLRARAELAAAEGNMTATCDARYFTRAADALEALADEVERLRNEKVGTHGSPELDEDARKLAALGQDPGPTFAADPAPVVCEWTNASGRTVSTCMPDGITPDGLMAWGWNGGNHGKCPNCGNRRKFTEAKE